MLQHAEAMRIYEAETSLRSGIRVLAKRQQNYRSGEEVAAVIGGDAGPQAFPAPAPDSSLPGREEERGCEQEYASARPAAMRGSLGLPISALPHRVHVDVANSE
jgi:hypothetical protein